MASRSRYVFLTSSELAGWLRETVGQLAVGVALDRGRGLPLEYWDDSEATLAASRRVYVTPNAPDLAAMQSDDLKLGQLGWVQLDVPRVDGACLRAVQIAAKSDWFDAGEQKVLKSPTALKLFDKLWARWKKHVAHPVWARNVVTGTEMAYRTIGYSVGAADWYRRGVNCARRGSVT